MLINEFMKLPLEQRKSHIDLTSDCINVGSRQTVKNRKLLMELYSIDNTPKGRILVCHACNNPNCINLYHIYFGTDRENIVEDGIKFGSFKNIWERRKEKYTEEELIAQQRKGDKAKGGRSGKGRPKSEEQKRKTAISVKEWHRKKKEGLL